jgi:hypothetical protein
MDINQKLQVGETLNIKIFEKSIPLLPVSFSLQITNINSNYKTEGIWCRVSTGSRCDKSQIQDCLTHSVPLIKASGEMF